MASGKILVFGKGYLGGRIAEYFGDRAMLSEADITDSQALRQEFESVQPSVVINAAAKTLTNQLEKPENQEQARLVNVQGAKNLAVQAQEYDAQMVQISTAMMFDGSGITEETHPEPKSVYAQTKAEADAAMPPEVLIVRIHTPLSKYAHPRNLLTKLIGFNQVVDEPSSLTVVEDLLPALEALINQKAQGIYNLVNPGSISLLEIIQLMKERGLIEENKPVKAISKTELNQMIETSGGAFQPYPILNTDKLQKAGITMREVHEAVEASIREYTL